MKSVKVVVTGPFNAGKTSLVRTASIIDIVTTERRITDPKDAEIKDETTVAMDYGQRRVGDTMVHLYGTPGQARFEFMGNILAHEMDAFILVIDATDRVSLADALQILRLFRKYSKTSYLVAVNDKPGPSSLTPDEISKLLKLPESVPVVLCDATDSDSVDKVLQEVVTLIASA